MSNITSEMTPFSVLTAAMVQDNGSHSIVLPADWLQGRTAYGGLSAALCLQATLRSIEDLPPLRSAQFCFVGPATGKLSISSDVLRKGKSTTLVGCDLTGDSGLAVRSTLCFVAGRTSCTTINRLSCLRSQVRKTVQAITFGLTVQTS